MYKVEVCRKKQLVDMKILSLYSGTLSDLFDKVCGGEPLHERDRIYIHSSQISLDRILYGNDGHLLNFQYILETGRIPAKQLFGSSGIGDGVSYIPDRIFKITIGNQHVNWKSGDAFMRALGSIRTNTMQRIEEMTFLQELLGKGKWDRDDRIIWERNISQIIAEEVDKIPGFGEYRTTSRIQFQRSAKKRPICLNDLSSDIENNTMDIEFDCEAMTTVEGIMLQQMDNMYLPTTAPKGDLKTISNYFYVTGAVEYACGTKGAHAFIQSSATGSIIEKTHKDPRDHYCEVSDPHYTIENMKRGEAAHTQRAVYGGMNILSR